MSYLGEASKVYSPGQRAQRVTFVYVRTRSGDVGFLTVGASGLGDLSSDAARLYEART